MQQSKHTKEVPALLVPPLKEQDIVDKLRIRASIRRQISGRKSVQEGKADRIAELCDEAADEIERLRKEIKKLSKK